MTSLGPSRRPRNARAAEPIKYVPKGWGYEKWIANCEKYCGKLLFIAKDKQCSWHYHKSVSYTHLTLPTSPKV